MQEVPKVHCQVLYEIYYISFVEARKLENKNNEQSETHLKCVFSTLFRHISIIG